MLFKDRVALVTGAASGIGRAAAIAFAREGACVTVADRDRARGSEVVTLIENAGGRALFVETDVTVEAAIIAMVKATVTTFGRLDAAFNNAGAPGSYKTAVDCTEDEWDAAIEVNMKSIWMCMKYEIPEMIKRGGGGIVNTASTAAVGALPTMFTYVTTKHAILGMSRSAAIDFATKNIRVNALLPGSTITPMLRAAWDGIGLSSFDTAAETASPMKRMAQPEEQAEAAIWLCSEKASFVNGTALMVDGGHDAVV